ncbi:Uncharacterised protein [Vibrio cholerae]|nr:Uncharacterised protein [Vibrio cholerae]
MWKLPNERIKYAIAALRSLCIISEAATTLS